MLTQSHTAAQLTRRRRRRLPGRADEDYDVARESSSLDTRSPLSGSDGADQGTGAVGAGFTALTIDASMWVSRYQLCDGMSKSAS